MSSLDITASPPLRLRQAIEGLFAVVSAGNQLGSLRRSGIFAGLCVAFGMGAAIGAFVTKEISDLAHGIPVVAPLIVLLRCEAQRGEGRI